MNFIICIVIYLLHDPQINLVPSGEKSNVVIPNL